MQAQEPPNGTKAGAFEVELERLAFHRHVLAFRLGVRREVAATHLTAVALGAGMIQAALDDILVVLAIWAVWLFHRPILTWLFPFRHSRVSTAWC